jgi:DNA primase
MARIRSESVERVRDAVDFAGLVGERTELRRVGAHSLEGLCPFHEERTPSFTIEPDRKLYYCFGCQASGDLITYVRELEGLEFRAAVELLADRCGIELEYEDEDPRETERRGARERLHALLERSAVHYARLLWESEEAAAARRYLVNDRGLGEEALRRFQVGYAPTAWDHLLRFATAADFSADELHAAGLIRHGTGNGRTSDYFRGRIMFPLRDSRGRVIGFGARATRADQRPKYINTPEGPLYRKGRHLYGVDLARPHATRAGEVVVCEGYTDVIALHQIGIQAAVGLMGTALTDAQLGELARLASTVVLCLDADKAGEEAMLRSARVATTRKLELQVVELPPGSDPAALAQSGGHEAIAAALERRVGIGRFQVQRILADGDHTSGEAIDRTLERLRPLFASLPPSATRMELTRIVADTVQLPLATLEQLLSARAGAQASSGDAGDATAVTLRREEEIERALLSLCIALPTLGGEILAGLDPEEHFTTALLRDAASIVADNGVAATLGRPEASGDGALERLLAALVVQSEREPASAARLEALHQQLRLTAIEHRLRNPSLRGAESVAELGLRRLAVKAQFDEAYARALDDAS